MSPYHPLRAAAIACMLGALLGCGEAPRPELVDLLLVNASIVDVEGGTVAHRRLIAVAGDTIYAVDTMAARERYDAATVVDAAGGYVAPGLWDMHVHFRGGDSLAEENRRLLPLFVAHGVTTVRDAGGDLTPQVLAWRARIARGELVGPGIYTSGPKLDGVGARWAGSIELAAPADVAAALDSLQRLGAAYVKVYDSTLPEGLYYAIVEAAEARGLKVTGHMPMDADLRRAVGLGLDGVEHLYYLLAGASPVGDSLRALGRGYRTIPALLATYDDSVARASFARLGERDFYVTPTLHIGHVLEALHDADHSADPLLPRISAGIVHTYAGRTASARARSAAAQRDEAALRQRFDAMVAPLHAAGVRLLAGSDCGAYNSFVYPGESLIRELQTLVDAGLTPREALASSVVEGPRFFDALDHYGAVARGKAADLIVLGGNPLEDVDRLEDLRFVIHQGHMYDALALDEMLGATDRRE